MRRLVSFALLAGAVAAPLTAQRPEVRASVGRSVAQYREQNAVLDFRGNGPTGRVDVSWRRFGVVASVTRHTLKPTYTNVDWLLPFRATETQFAVRYRPLLKLPAEVEIGTLKRTASPIDNAQALRAYRLGIVAHLPLADGAELEPRAAWLVGSKFSGGGSAKTAVTLGLRAAYRPLARYGWGWVVMDYAFERFDRRTDVAVPLQGSTLNFGFEARVVP